MKTVHALRWWIVGLVMLGAMLNDLTRAVMGVAAPGLPPAPPERERFDGPDLPIDDEAAQPGTPNFTGAFVGLACQDTSGTAAPADLDWFEYRERPFISETPAR